MLISQIYHKYQIPKNLQRHMLEVAAVASYLVDNTENDKVDKQTVVETALLHDMGNIVKFKDFISPQMKMGEDYWRKVQKKFIQKYGESAHQATIKIIKEINLVNEKSVINLLEKVGYTAIIKNGYISLESRICDYADMCVSPLGIVGFNKRIEDLLERYNLDLNDRGTKIRHDNSLELQKSIQTDLKNIPKQDFSDLIKSLSEYDISLKV
ncbi:MAG: HD domain-containing protein [Candidatus Pacebacteria bacterium]|nr:HD domain-containing protein [Candidatus Paceibacterota bacterium]